MNPPADPGRLAVIDGGRVTGPRLGAVERVAAEAGFVIVGVPPFGFGVGRGAPRAPQRRAGRDPRLMTTIERRARLVELQTKHLGAQLGRCATAEEVAAWIVSAGYWRSMEALAMKHGRPRSAMLFRERAEAVTAAANPAVQP